MLHDNKPGYVINTPVGTAQLMLVVCKDSLAVLHHMQLHLAMQCGIFRTSNKTQLGHLV